jgi:hypothetical protein
MGIGDDFPGNKKRPGREADNSPPPSTEINNGGAIPLRPHMSSRHSAQVINYRDSLPVCRIAYIAFRYPLLLRCILGNGLFNT